MKLYKDGKEINAEKSQLHLMLSDGWSMKEETEEDLIAIVSASEEKLGEDIVEEKITPPKKVTPRKKVTPKKTTKITPIKITDKE